MHLTVSLHVCCLTKNNCLKYSAFTSLLYQYASSSGMLSSISVLFKTILLNSCLLSGLAQLVTTFIIKFIKWIWLLTIRFLSALYTMPILIFQFFSWACNSLSYSRVVSSSSCFYKYVTMFLYMVMTLISACMFLGLVKRSVCLRCALIK